MGFWDSILGGVAQFISGLAGESESANLAQTFAAPTMGAIESGAAAAPSGFYSPASYGSAAAGDFFTGGGSGSGAPPSGGQNIFSQVGNAVVPAVAGGLTTVGLNSMFGRPPAVKETDTRTPQQMALNNAQLGSYQQLAGDYTKGQTSLPMWNPVEEEDIRRNTLAEMARSGVADSGQAMAAVNRNLTDYRMRVGQQHEQNQIARGGQLVSGSMPSRTATTVPAYYPASSAPTNFAIQPGARNDTMGRDANGGQPVTTSGTAQREKNPFDSVGPV